MFPLYHAGPVTDITLCWTLSHNPSLNRPRRTMCEFTAASPCPELRSSDISTMSHRHDRSSWSLRHHGSPRGSAVYHAHWAGSLSPLLPIHFSTVSLLFSFNRKPSHSFRVHWKSGLAWKWHHQQKEMNRVKERKSARKKRENTVNTAKCSVSVMYTSQLPPSTPPPETGPAIRPALPSCLLAAVQSNEVVMSLVVMSITLNLTSHGLNQILKETSQWKHFNVFQLPRQQHAFLLVCLLNSVYPSTPAKHFHKQFYSLYPIFGFLAALRLLLEK